MRDIYNYSIVKLRKAGLNIPRGPGGLDLINRFKPHAHGAWISFPPPLFLYYPAPLFKIFIIILFSSFDDISRRIGDKSYTISKKTVDTEYKYYS